MLEVLALPAFSDNYIWLAHDGQHAVVIDPGDAAPVLACLEAQRLQLSAILLTHHHPDHIGGVRTVLARHPAQVIGHHADAHRLPPLTTPVEDGAVLQVPGLDWQVDVIATPGHTTGHICYYGAGLLFCGDTLFRGGCGRMFEGTPEQYSHSLKRLAALPADTAVYPAHEYTVDNLLFAASLTPDDTLVQAALRLARQTRLAGQPTLPSSIGWEQRHNPYLRCEEPDMLAALQLPPATTAATAFATMRQMKDQFRPAPQTAP
jgi:hydroxyacylglutathione hydrolase